LAPGASATYTATYVVVQSDVDNGNIHNEATVTGDDPNGNPIEDTDEEDVTIIQNPAIKIVKSAASGNYGVGDVITFNFNVTNTGNVTLNNIMISDPLPGISAITFGTWPGVPGELKPGEVVTATATYTVKQIDVDYGSLSNSATVTGDDPNGDPTDDTACCVIIRFFQNPDISMVKTATSTGQNVGDVITYTFVATNTGNVTLSNVEITDELLDISPITYGSWPGTPGVLLPGEAITGTATYTIKQIDIDRGLITNLALGTGDDPKGNPVSDDDCVIIPIVQSPGITIDKVASNGNFGVGDVITYTFTATNSGNVTLTNVSISDPLVGLSALTYGSWPGATGVLSPGQSVSATATYTVTQADVDAGSISNTATATGKDLNNNPVSDDDSVVTPIDQILSINLEKIASTGSYGVGDLVTYTFIVTNTGNVTLSNVTVSDPLPGLSAITPSSVTTMAPGATASFTATYTVTQADVDNGGIYNTATAIGDAPNGDDVTDTDDETVPLTQSPAIDIAKIASTGNYGVGDLVTYTFIVTNTGNVTLSNVIVSDPLPGLSTISPASVASLSPGAAVSFTATYIVTQADVDNGSVYNTATAIGDAPNGDDITDTDDETVPLTQTPSIHLTKTVSTGNYGVGDVVSYTFVATNTGNVTLTNVVISDILPGLSPISYSWPGTPGVLLPGETVNASATYTVKQQDVDFGLISNQATVTGDDPNGDPVDDTACCAIVTFDQNPAIKVVKTVSASSFNVGDVITYTFVATNTGNVTLYNVVISDILPGLSAITYGTWPGSAGVLKPNQSVTATATYVITQIDVDRGVITNIAKATGKDLYNNQVMDDDCIITTIPQMPSIQLLKVGNYIDSNGDNVMNVGDHIQYSFTVKNTGNVTVSDITVTDPKLTIIAGPITLNPGEQDATTFSGTYAITQQDLDSQGVYNLATATGKDPNDADVSSNSKDPNPLDPGDPFYDPNCPDCTFVPLPWTPIDAQDDSFGTFYSIGGVTSSVLDNDMLDNVLLDPNDITLTPGTPSYPGLVMNPDGTILIPVGIPAGLYTYSYTICELVNPSNCDNGVATIEVQQQDIIAQDDSFGPINSITGAVTTSVLDNDLLNGVGINSGDVILTPGVPSYPGLTMNPDGTINIPSGTPMGTYTYPYTICETYNPLNCGSATATINVIVYSSPDFNVTNINVPVIGDVNTNDEVPTGTTYGNPVASVDNPNGNLPVINGDGTYTFVTPDPGKYVFDIEVCAPGQSSPCPTEKLTITVLDEDGINLPIANNDIASVQGDDTTPATVTIPVKANDTPGNIGGTLGNPVVSNSGPNAPSHGVVSVNPNGEIEYTPDAGFYGVDVFVYEICELPSGLCTEAIVKVTVTMPDGGNTTNAADDYAETYVDTPLSINAADGLLANDTDPEGHSQSVTSGTYTVIGKGSLVVNNDGSYVFTPESGYKGPVEFVYEVTDAMGAIANATLHILVKDNGIESLPDFNTTYVDVPVSGNVNTNDIVPSGTTYGSPVADISNPQADLPVINSDGSYVFVTDSAGVYVFEVSVCLPGQSSGCATETLTITVLDPTTNLNPPIANDDSAVTNGHPTTPLPVTIIVKGNDGPGNIGGTLGSPIVNNSGPNAPSHGVVGTDGAGNVIYTPDPAFYGTDVFVYEICESPSGLCTQTTVTVLVLEPFVSDNLTFAYDDYRSTPKNTSLSVNAANGVLANDMDPEGNNQTVVNKVETIPGKGTLTLLSDGSYTFTPETDYVGPVEFVYSIYDDGAPSATSTATLHILVLGVPDLTPSQFFSATVIEVGETIKYVVAIRNIGDGATNGEIKFNMSNYSVASGMTLTLSSDPSTVIAGNLIYNQANDFNLSFSPFGVDVTSKPGVFIAPGERRYLIFNITRTGGIQGATNTTVTIVGHTGGGETPTHNNNISNNVIKPD
ncbi:MAG: DUF11 domain-containing protein, partial [Saprospiraceae bacterium]|nr:DUF11 domain-containing protein [Saprospiraceae bacterium]